MNFEVWPKFAHLVDKIFGLSPSRALLKLDEKKKYSAFRVGEVVRREAFSELLKSDVLAKNFKNIIASRK